MRSSGGFKQASAARTAKGKPKPQVRILKQSAHSEMPAARDNGQTWNSMAKELFRDNVDTCRDALGLFIGGFRKAFVGFVTVGLRLIPVLGLVGVSSNP